MMPGLKLPAAPVEAAAEAAYERAAKRVGTGQHWKDLSPAAKNDLCRDMEAAVTAFLRTWL